MRVGCVSSHCGLVQSAPLLHNGIIACGLWERSQFPLVQFVYNLCLIQAFYIGCTVGVIVLPTRVCNGRHDRP